MFKTLAAGLLSAYMAATSIGAPLPEVKTFSTNSAIVETIDSDATSQRRRAVRRAPTPSIDATFMSPSASSLTLTNYDNAPANVKACLATCTEFSLPPNDTATYDLASLGTSPILTLKSSTNALAATTERGTMTATRDFATRQALPVADLERFYQENVILSTSPGVATFSLHGFEGAIETSFTSDYSAGLTTIPLPWGVAATGKHIEVTTNTPTQALATLLNSKEARTIAAERYDQASIENYLLRATDTTQLHIINPNTLESHGAPQFLQEDTGNTFSAPHNGIKPQGSTHYKNPIQATGGFGNGALRIPTALPLLSFSTIPSITLEEMAVGRTGLSNDNTTSYSVWFQNGTAISLANATKEAVAVSGTIEAYNGTQRAGSKTYNLAPNGSTTVNLTDLPAERYAVSVNPGPQGNLITPLVAATSTDGTVTWEGYKTETPAAKVTGEEYVSKWMDSLKQQYFFISYDEMAAAINGSSINRSYIDDIVNAVWTDPRVQNGFGTKDNVKQWFFSRVDENPANSEFCKTEKATHQAGFGLRTRDGISCGPVDFKPDAPGIDALFNTWREFYKQDIEGNPAKYGGSLETGPDLDTKPPWYFGQ
jgi:hypothetical protein